VTIFVGKPVRPVFFGGLCLAVGALVGVYFAVTAIGNYRWLPAVAGVAGFLCGALAWNRHLRNGWNGAVVGAAAAVSAHFLTWLLLAWGQWGCYKVTGECRAGGDAPMNPLEALVGSLVYGGISLGLCGWVTVPVGAGLGWLCAETRPR
jgi:hypothetical protein